MKWLIYLFALLFISCDLIVKNDDDKDDDDKKNAPQPNEREFWVIDHTKSRGEAGRFYKLATYKAYDDSTTLIYAQSNPNLLDSVTADKIGKEFTSYIKVKVEEIFGGASDVDKNGRIILLIFDIKDGATANSGFIGGYFYNADMFSQATLNASGNSDIKSNQAEILYIDSKEQNPSSAKSLHTVAHEYQHMINFNQRSSTQATWINEGLSEATEFELYGKDALAGRFNYMQSTSFNLGRSLIHWNSDAPLSNYALAATFMNFASNQAGDATARKSFLSAVQKYSGNNHHAISHQLSAKYSGANLEDKFKKIFHHYVRSALVKVESGSFVSTTKSDFSGIGFTVSATSNDKGYVPRVLKYNKNASVSVTGSGFKIFDLQNAAYSEQTSIASLSEFDNKNYGLILLSNFLTSENQSAVYNITQPLSIVRERKPVTMLGPESFRTDYISPLKIEK